jgi:hypothetical protein
VISIGGKDYKTLSDPIFVNGKRIKEVYVNDKKVYPETDNAWENYINGEGFYDPTKYIGRHIKLRGHKDITFPITHYRTITHYLFASSNYEGGVKEFRTEKENPMLINLHVKMDFVCSHISFDKEEDTND